MLTVVKANFQNGTSPYSASALHVGTKIPWQFLSNSGKVSFTPPPGFLTVDPLTSISSSSWAYTRKDIPDFNGRHGDGGHGLTEAAAVHYHHEQVAAWDLLDDKGPGGTRGTDKVGHSPFLV